jgi:hypothetical protein
VAAPPQPTANRPRPRNSDSILSVFIQSSPCLRRTSVSSAVSSASPACQIPPQAAVFPGRVDFFQCAPRESALRKVRLSDARRPPRPARVPLPNDSPDEGFHNAFCRSDLQISGRGQASVSSSCRPPQLCSSMPR